MSKPITLPPLILSTLLIFTPIEISVQFSTFLYDISILVPLPIEIARSTQLLLPLSISRGKHGSHQPRMIPPPYLFLASSPIDVHHMSHVDLVTATIRNG